MSAVIMIPARYASTRYPGKPLVELTGATGVAMSLIERTWRAAQLVDGADAVYVTTDDARIANAAQGFGAKVIMTSEACQNGTERCAEAYETLGQNFDIIINFQGDAPLTPHWFIDDLIAGLTTDQTADVATPVLSLSGSMLAQFKTDRVHGRVGGTTAVFGQHHQALYFSKEVIPYSAADYADHDQTPLYHHVGVYGYRPNALQAYTGLPTGPLEQMEGLEQLRFLEHGYKIQCVEVDAKGREFWELNNPHDVAILEKLLEDMQMI